MTSRFDPIAEITSDPARIDPFTRHILAQLSLPPTHEAVLEQAAFRALAITPSCANSAYAGKMVAWFFVSTQNDVVDNITVSRLQRGKVGPIGEEDVEKVLELLPFLEEEDS